MKDSEIYLRAAELVSDGRYPNNIYTVMIEFVGRREAGRLERYFDESLETYGFGFYDGSIDKSRNSRVLALLFMAAIAKDEGR